MSTVISLNESITLPSSRRRSRIRYTPSGTRWPASSRPFHQKRCLIERFVDPASSRSSTSLRTSLPSESITEKRTRARSVRSKPSRTRSRTPSPLGEKRIGTAAKRSTSGNSLFSCCVTRKAAIVASTSRANTALTRGRVMARET